VGYYRDNGELNIAAVVAFLVMNDVVAAVASFAGSDAERSYFR